MISRRTGEVLLALVLVLSLSLKLWGDENAQTEAPDKIADRVAGLLGEHGFKVEHNPSDEDLFSLSATKGQCLLLTAVLSPHGWHRDVIHKAVPDGGQVLFVFDGRIYPDQPVLLTRAAHYSRRFLRHAGFDAPPRPVLGIVGWPGCELDMLVRALVAMPGLGRA
jgi:hypothetical protein